MSVKSNDGASLPRLAEVMRRLLGEGGCPWDREQTLRALKRYCVEEAHEVCDAIDALGPDAEVPVTDAGPRVHGPDSVAVHHHREELGDLLFQVVFQSGLAASWGWFTLDDVIHGIADKLERRHPHVFGDGRAGSASEVIAAWEKLKRAEKADRGTLDGVPRSLPALHYALRIGEKAARVGFDWPDAHGPRAKVEEELHEFDRAVAEGNRDAMADELGDLLFSVVNLARKHGIDPEEALTRSNRRFVARFQAVEARARAAGRPLDAHSLDELDAYWNAAKTDEHAP
jgi:tetrapyrrole methylase family protein/MazG family protein/ATP diphosphatase